jgi:ABC-type transport system substrate-binding protein
MTRPSLPSVIVAVLILVAAVLIAAPAGAQTGKPKRGGILNSVLTEDPPGLLVHESATISNVWPMSPCYSNLVLFDPLKPLESVDTVIPELAERWSWQDNYKNLVFFLRKNVKWHDGKPFTSADVKYTFDVAREAPDAPAKLRLSARNPRCSSCSRPATRRSSPPTCRSTSCASAAWAPGLFGKRSG